MFYYYCVYNNIIALYYISFYLLIPFVTLRKEGRKEGNQLPPPPHNRWLYKLHWEQEWKREGDWAAACPLQKTLTGHTAHPSDGTRLNFSTAHTFPMCHLLLPGVIHSFTFKGQDKWIRKFVLKMFSEARGFPGGSDGKEYACNTEDLGLIPGSGRFPGGMHGNPLQCSCLENSRDRGAWWATVHGV